jgi:hypothetical protein
MNTCGTLQCRDYEQQADIDLAHAVLAAMEQGEIPTSPLLADFDLVRRADLTEPSAN